MSAKHKMGHFKRGTRSGWNYRGYCVVEKHKGNAGLRWEMADECGELHSVYRTLAEFRRTTDRWERQRAKKQS